MRHGFAVNTILDSYRDGGDPGARLALLSTYLGHIDPGKTYWYSLGLSGVAGAGGGAAGASPRRWRMTALATTLQAFFTDRLIRQRQVSPHTLAAYRDTLRLLLVFASARQKREPSKLDIDDLDAPLIGAFLDHLEHQRENSVRTRNARLAAIRSLFRYAALRHPEHAAVIERVLAIPPKRFDRTARDLLDRAGIRRTAGCAGSVNLDWPARQRPVRACRPDRPAGVRVDRPSVRRCPSWRRSACGLLWERDESSGSRHSRPA